MNNQFLRLLATVMLFWLALPAIARDPAREETRIILSAVCPSVVEKDSTESKALERTRNTKTVSVASKIGGALASAGVSAVVDLAQRSLSAAAAGKSDVLPASHANGRFYGLTPAGDLLLSKELGCVSVVRARFSASRVPHAESNDPDWFKPIRTNATTMGIDSVPSLYFEAVISADPSGAYFTLAPSVMFVGDFYRSSPFRQVRDYSIALTFKAAGAETPFASEVFVFRDLPRNTLLRACTKNTTFIQTKECAAPDRGSLWGLRSSYLSNMPLDKETEDAKADQQEKSAPYFKAAGILKSLSAPPPMPSIEEGLIASGLALNGVGCSDGATKSSSCIIQPSEDLKDYCAALENANSQLPEALQSRDPKCPPDLAVATAALSQASASRLKKARLNWANAFELWLRNRCQRCFAGAGSDKWCQSNGSRPDNEKENSMVAICRDVYESPNQPAAASLLTRFTPSPPTSIGPVQVSGTVTEIRQPNAVAVFLAGIFTSAAPEITEALKSELPAAKKAEAEARSAADAAATIADRTARREVELALLKVKVAEANLATKRNASAPDESEVLEAEIALVEAKIAANDAFRKAGKTPPYPQYD